MITFSKANRHFFYLSYYLVVGVLVYILSIGYLMEEIPKLVIIIPTTLGITWLIFILLFGKRDPKGRTSLFTYMGQKILTDSLFIWVGVAMLIILAVSMGMDILTNLWVTLSLITGVYYLLWTGIMETIWKKQVDTND